MSENEVVILREAEPKKILRTAIAKKVPAIMSYLSKGKWHVAKVFLAALEAERFSIESAGPPSKPKPINIQVNQPVGIAIKYKSGKFVFDTTVVGFEPSGAPADRGWGGTIVLAVPDQVEVVQRRSYFRVNVPESLKVNVVLWHRRKNHALEPHTNDSDDQRAASEDPRNYYKGRLADISAGGAQVVIPHENGAGQDSSGEERPDFKKGQFIAMRFTPMPYEMPLMLDAQIRHVLPTADGKSTSLGLQIVGLEASPEGHGVLSRLVGIVEQYYRTNRTSAKQQDMQPVPVVAKVAKQIDY